MNKLSFSQAFPPGGILRWSTACILAGTLSSCERSYVATEKDVEMANMQKQIDTLDAERANLQSGEVTNNFHIDRVGFYHAGARDFYDYPYNFERDGRYFVDGGWQDQLGVNAPASSRPSAAALKKVDAALAEEQKLAAQPQSSGGGLGAGNALMMYWLLSGNRGAFSSGAGFQQARQNVGDWQQDVDKKREETRTYAYANPGYSRIVQKAKAGGTSVKAGQSVRGGFGSSSSRGGGGFSFGG